MPARRKEPPSVHNVFASRRSIQETGRETHSRYLVNSSEHELAVAPSLWRETKYEDKMAMHPYRASIVLRGEEESIGLGTEHVPRATVR
jgi:hypothetical protein